MPTNCGHHKKNIQINEPLCLVAVFPTCLFGTMETPLGKETCEKDIGEEQGKHILIYLLAIRQSLSYWSQLYSLQLQQLMSVFTIFSPKRQWVI